MGAEELAGQQLAAGDGADPNPVATSSEGDFLPLLAAVATHQLGNRQAILGGGNDRADGEEVTSSSKTAIGGVNSIFINKI